MISEYWTFGLQNLFARTREPFFSNLRTFGLKNLRTPEPSNLRTFGLIGCNRDIARASAGRFGISSFITSVGGYMGDIRGFWSTIEDTFCNVWLSKVCLNTVVEGYVKGKRKRGRPRKQYIDNIKQWEKMTISQCSRAAEDHSHGKEIVSQVMRPTNKHDLPINKKTLIVIH